jgi:hypothetical protein
MIATGMIARRSFLAGAGVSLLCTPDLMAAGRAQPAPITVLSAPLELIGDWDGSPPSAAALVISRMREVSLSGVRLLSDRQPDRLRIDEHSSGPPAIWLHKDPPTTAWIIVDIGARDWCKLAYQFGHELGHVLCNSWGPEAKPQPPSQWLEEALAEAFSLRGLGLLAASWEHNPPFSNDAPFASSIREYLGNQIKQYENELVPNDDLGAWFRSRRDALPQGVGVEEGPAIIAILADLIADKACVEDMGALNRWPRRTGVPVEEYLSLWQQSCAELAACGRLPVQLRSMLKLG